MKQYTYAELKEEVAQRKLDAEKRRLMYGNCNCNNCNKEIQENEVRSMSNMNVICKNCDQFLEAITLFCFIITCCQGKTSWEKLRLLKESK